ncbi:MAG: hypothetical protein SVR04_10035 [Spirochaetota bacterium]|nr:hypothetical protein [Spirochaetota bacterium]
MERIEKSEGARRADRSAAELDKQDQARREKQAEELRAKQDNAVYVRMFKDGSTVCLSPMVAEKYLRRGKGRIVRRMPPVEVLRSDVERGFGAFRFGLQTYVLQIGNRIARGDVELRDRIEKEVQKSIEKTIANTQNEVRKIIKVEIDG